MDAHLASKLAAIHPLLCTTPTLTFSCQQYSTRLGVIGGDGGEERAVKRAENGKNQTRLLL